MIENINSPQDLKILSPDELCLLADEMRSLMASTVASTGGHLSSNLGAVELTIALHVVFDSPKDRIVWDVGHQSYAHKILTGRRDRFATLRQFGGLSGFPDRSESEHDAYGGGHAGVSISAALGMAVARDYFCDDYHVIAVIGDGSLGSGNALEALNHAGHCGTRLIVVLNDNGMSISPTVGSLFGLVAGVHDSQSSVASRHSWERTGFRYFGPVDGHEIGSLIHTLRQAAEHADGPVVVHVITRKGRGLPDAETDPVGYHGLSPKMTPPKNASVTSPACNTVFSRALRRIMAVDRRVVAITAAMLDGTGLVDLVREFPGRIFDVGIAEQHAVGIAAGMATRGMIPVVAIYSTFLQRAFDQIATEICLQDLPVVFAVDRAGIVGDDGKTHQGLFDLSFLRALPGMVVSAPKDENELPHLLYTAVNSGRPFSLRYPRGSIIGSYRGEKLNAVPIGKGEVLRHGSDCAILGIGNVVHAAQQAADRLSKKGVSCTVANMRFAKPIDEELVLDLATRTGMIITVEENVTSGGFGSAVLETLAAAGVNDVAVECIGLPDQFIAHGTQALLRSRCGVDADGIESRVTALMRRSRSDLRVFRMEVTG